MKKILEIILLIMVSPAISSELAVDPKTEIDCRYNRIEVSSGSSIGRASAMLREANCIQDPNVERIAYVTEAEYYNKGPRFLDNPLLSLESLITKQVNKETMTVQIVGADGKSHYKVTSTDYTAVSVWRYTAHYGKTIIEKDDVYLDIEVLDLSELENQPLRSMSNGFVGTVVNLGADDYLVKGHNLSFWQRLKYEGFIGEVVSINGSLQKGDLVKYHNDENVRDGRGLDAVIEEIFDNGVVWLKLSLKSQKVIDMSTRIENIYLASGR